MYKNMKYQMRIVECRLLSTVLRICGILQFFKITNKLIYTNEALFYNVLTFKFELIQVFTNRKDLEFSLMKPNKIFVGSIRSYVIAEKNTSRYVIINR